MTTKLLLLTTALLITSLACKSEPSATHTPPQASSIRQATPPQGSFAPNTLSKEQLEAQREMLNAILDELELKRPLGPEGAAKLAQSPKLATLIQLDLSADLLDEQGAKALASSPYLNNLTTLNLWSNQLSDEGAKAIASSSHLKHLTKLGLWNNRIGDEGAKALASSPYLKTLTKLELWSNRIGDEGAAALASSPHLPESIRAQWRR